MLILTLYAFSRDRTIEVKHILRAGKFIQNKYALTNTVIAVMLYG
jgi:hypothetical protein